MENSTNVFVESDDKLIKSASIFDIDVNGNKDKIDGNNSASTKEVHDDRICKILISTGSTNVYSVLKTSFCSVEYTEEMVANDTEASSGQGRIGSGSKRVQFFYEDDNSPKFPPVYVQTEAEVEAVAAFVAEKAEEFKRRGGGGIPGEGHQQYYSKAAVAKFTLQEAVIKHIKCCFTKKGMNQFKAGLRKKRNYHKRSTIFNPKREKFDENESIDKIDPINTTTSKNSCDMPQLESIVPEIPDNPNNIQQTESTFDEIPTSPTRMPQLKSNVSNNNMSEVKNENIKSTVPSNVLRGVNKGKSVLYPISSEQKTGPTKPLILSAELSSLLDVAPDATLTRLQIVTRLWRYLTEHNLQDPQNKLWFTPDLRMAPIFGKEKIKCFGMDNYLKGHMLE